MRQLFCQYSQKETVIVCSVPKLQPCPRSPSTIKPTLGSINHLFFCGWLYRNRKEVYLGDDNSLTLTFHAKNEGEGGAYEADLYVVLPPEADYSGIARNNEVTRNARRSEKPTTSSD